MPPARRPQANSGIGPTLPTLASQQVGGYLKYGGRGAEVIAKAAPDPLRTLKKITSRLPKDW